MRRRHPLQRLVIFLAFTWFSSFFWLDFIHNHRLQAYIFGGLWLATFLVAVPWMVTDGFLRLPGRWRDI